MTKYRKCEEELEKQISDKLYFIPHLILCCTSERKSVHIYELIKANSQIDYDTIDASIIASTGCSASSEYEIIYFQSIIEKKSIIHHCYPENTSEVNQFH